MNKRQKKENFSIYNFFPKNRKGLSPILIIVIVLLIAGGVYLYLQSQKTTPGTENQPTGNAVDISNFAFSPAELTVSVGDTVTWTNKDSAPHTIVSDTGSELASSTLSNGGTYSHTFGTAGTYDYHCGVHPSMKGKIIVG